MKYQTENIEEILYPLPVLKKKDPGTEAIGIFIAILMAIFLVGFIGFVIGDDTNGTHVVEVKEEGWDYPQVLVEDEDGQRAWFWCKTQVMPERKKK